MNWFITGTDTGVGKTHTACLILEALRRAGYDAVGFKPICCGERDDVRALWEASGKRLDLSLDAINPVWLRPPAAPLAASAIEERLIQPADILSAYKALKARHATVLVEGVGGWRVPILENYDTTDLAADLGLPVVIVVHNRLGAINHTLLTIESIQRKGLPIAGLILNEFSPRLEDEIPIRTNPAILEKITRLPILFTIRENQTSLDIALA